VLTASAEWNQLHWFAFAATFVCFPLAPINPTPTTTTPTTTNA
jgi:hypothetical protein